MTLRRLSSSSMMSTRLAAMASSAYRQHDRHRRAGAGLAFDVDGAAVIAHDGVRDGKSQARAVLFGGEEGIEHARQRVGRNPRPLIAHACDHGARTVSVFRVRRNGDFIAVTACGDGIEKEI